MKTFEQQCRTWNAGFRGYKDNSPEAKDRRERLRQKQLLDRGLTVRVIIGDPIYNLLSKSKFCKRIK